MSLPEVTYPDEVRGDMLSVFESCRSANWRDTVDKNGVPTVSPSKDKFGYGCQHCGGPLDALKEVGHYECPWCIARFPLKEQD